MRVFRGGDVVIDGTLTEGSSRSLKQNITEMPSEEILERINKLTLHEWSYTSAPENRHFGPMAEDFYEIFGFGRDARHVAPRDLAGVALAAVKGVQEKNNQLTEQNRQLRERMDQLEILLTSMTSAN